jgi:hypothetical protein
VDRSTMTDANGHRPWPGDLAAPVPDGAVVHLDPALPE